MRDRRIREDRTMAQILTVCFALLAALACAVAFRQRRNGQTLARQTAELVQALAARDSEDHQRMARLEHDLKSPLGALLGFSTLLRELVHDHLQQPPPAILKSVNGIDQAARKMLQIIEAAGSRNPHADRQEGVIERSR